MAKGYRRIRGLIGLIGRYVSNKGRWGTLQRKASTKAMLEEGCPHEPAVARRGSRSAQLGEAPGLTAMIGVASRCREEDVGMADRRMGARVGRIAQDRGARRRKAMAEASLRF